jgi:hypothetical protein
MNGFKGTLSRSFKFEGTLLQEFVELVKKGNRLEAVRHAKKFLAMDENQQLGKLL